MNHSTEDPTSLQALFAPRSVAVVGASRDAASVGHRVLLALRNAGFTGSVFPVNPAATDVAGLPAVPSVRDLAGRVDLAIVAVPAAAIPAVVDDCAAAGVRGLVVLSAGFSEIPGDDGDARQAALVSQVRHHGMRMIGPNCIGTMNTDPAIRLNASFVPVYPPRGRIAFASQSGALGITALAQARDRCIGLSSFASIGNSADVSTEDLLEYWAADPATDLVLLYLESFKDPRRLARVASQVGRHTTIVAMKAGRSAAGARAASSHTAALAAPDVAVDAVFHQAGIIRADTLDEMLDIAVLLAHQPLPSGRRVAIVTNAGGPGILAADACAAAGLDVVALSAETRRSLATHLPPLAAVGNPVDMIASAGGAEYVRTIGTLRDAPEVDAVIVIFTPIDLRRTDEILEGIREALVPQAGPTATKPILVCLMPPAPAAIQAPDGTTLPAYPFPEQAVHALSKVVRYAEWRAQAPTAPRHPDGVPLGRLDAMRERLMAEGRSGWLLPDDVAGMLAAAGIRAVRDISADTATGAVDAAERLGYPVALKLRSATVTHKTDVGGVHLGLRNAAAVIAAFGEIEAAARDKLPAGAMEGVIVQQMAPPGVELLIGVTRDPQFGVMVGVGLGGTTVELFGDVHFRVAPLTVQDIDAMLRETRAYRLLRGFRGRGPADLESVRDLVGVVAQLAERVPNIAELDLNPVIVLPAGQGYVVADARIRFTGTATVSTPLSTPEINAST